MPGIVGLISKMPHQWAELQLQKMLGAVRHDQRYSTGTWADDRAGVYVGWTALAGSFADGMPLRSEREQALLVFSGEEYSARDLKRRLKAAGHLLDLDDGGPSYLVHAAQEADFPGSLNGRFHGL